MNPNVEKRKFFRNSTLGKTPCTLTLVLAAASTPSVTGWANEYTVDPIVITARKRSEMLQDVPFSVQALSESELRERGVTDLESISRSVAGFSVQNLGPGQSQVAIRGVSSGQIAQDQPGIKEQVGVYLDESVISMALFTPDLDLYDIDRVEVLRGPQGTLFGSGSLSGTVRYISAEPSLEGFEASVQTGVHSVYEGGNGGDIKGMLNLPLFGAAALRLVGYTSEFAGFIDAVQPGGGFKEDINNGNRYGVRAALLLQPTDNLRIIPRLVYQQVEYNGSNQEDEFNLLANEFTTSRERVRLDDYQRFQQLDEKFEDEFTLADLKVEWNLGAVTLTSISSWSERDILLRRDATASVASVTGGSITWPEGVYTLDAPLSDLTRAETRTQELRLSSNGSGAVNWVAGVFYSDAVREYSQSLSVPGFEEAVAAAAATNPNLALDRIYLRGTAGELSLYDELFFSDIPYDLEQMAVFGEVDFKITDKLTLTTGIRWFDFNEERTLNRDGILPNQLVIGQTEETADSGYSPRIMANYKVSSDFSLNAQVARGFRLGGINDPLKLGACSGADLDNFGPFVKPFDNEIVTNYELGSKMTLRDGSSTFNISIFRSDIENLQTTVNAVDCDSHLTVSVPEATAMGLEFELQAFLTDNLEIGFSGSYVDSELGSTILAADGSVLSGLREGNRLPTVPEYQAAVSATYNFEWKNQLEGAATFTIQHVGERHTQTADLDPTTGTVDLDTNVGDIPTEYATLAFDPLLDAYNIANFRLSANAFHWQTSFYIDNLTNEKAELGLDRERGFKARYGHWVNRPRTYGLTVNYSF